MPTLHLGVTDIPYTNTSPTAVLRKKRRSGMTRAVTTGDVAEFLENRYHVMEHFTELHGEHIGDALLDSVQGALENLLMGGPAQANPFSGGLAKVETLFRQMLTARELDAIGYPGIPTQAALEGRSSRFKRKRGSVRPSFIDTGLYENSFRAWID